MNYDVKAIRRLLAGPAKKLVVAIETTMSAIFSRNKRLSSLYYFLFSARFDREHKSVLAGKRMYYRQLSENGVAYALLRRNIHRLEKGLIMRPRRDVFAEDYIEETVQCFINANKTNSVCTEEMKWFSDVLTEYFRVVADARPLAKARALYMAGCDSEACGETKSVPYRHGDLPSISVSFEDLTSLFVRRRSVRWYQDRPVPMALIESAVNCASLAPSACNRQPYKFYVSSSKEKALAMARLAGGTVGFVNNLQCVIAVVGDLSAYPLERDRHLIYIDSSLATMQLMLALESLGLSTCPLNWPDVGPAELKMTDLLGLKDHERTIMLLAIGYADQEGGIPYSQKKQAAVLLNIV